MTDKENNERILEIYEKCIHSSYIDDVSENIKNIVDIIINCGQNAPLKCSIASLFAKLLYPEWDTRKHQTKLQDKKFMSLRTFDRKFTCPILFEKGIYKSSTEYALTRSFEKSFPFNLDYGDVTDCRTFKSGAGKAFLELVNLINNQSQIKIENIIQLFIIKINKQSSLIEEIYQIGNNEKLLSNLLNEILSIKTQGISVLPTLMITAIYEINIKFNIKWKAFRIDDLENHTTADKRSNKIGDIECYNDKKIICATEIKHNQEINNLTIKCFEEKIKGIDYDIKYKYIITSYMNQSFIDSKGIKVYSLMQFIHINLDILDVEHNIYIKELKDIIYNYKNIHNNLKCSVLELFK